MVTNQDDLWSPNDLRQLCPVSNQQKKLQILLDWKGSWKMVNNKYLAKIIVISFLVYLVKIFWEDKIRLAWRRQIPNHCLEALRGICCTPRLPFFESVKQNYLFKHFWKVTVWIKVSSILMCNVFFVFFMWNTIT